MTNTRFPGRQGWRAGRGHGTHRTKIRHDDVITPAFPSASAASEGILGTARVSERLGHFRHTFGYSSEEEEFAGYPDSAIEDVTKRYRTLLNASGVVSVGQERGSASADHRITRPSSSLQPTGFSLSSPIIPRFCESVTRFPGSVPQKRGSILSVQAGTVPVPHGPTVLDPTSGTVPELSQSVQRLSGAFRESPTRFSLKNKDVCKVSRGLYLEQAEVSSKLDPEQLSYTDWNHNQVAPSQPSKIRSGKVGSLWQCRRKGFQQRWIRKRDAAIYGRSPASRRREEERYLAEEDLSGTISPDSGNDSAQSNSSSTAEFVDLMTRKSSSSLSSTSTSILTFDLPTPCSPAPVDRRPPPLSGQTPSPLPAAAASHWRKRRCRRCSGCLATDCGVCYACRDMVKHGGRGISKQACSQRRCRQPIHPPSDCQQIPSPNRTPSTMRTGSLSISSTSSPHPGGISSPSTGWKVSHNNPPTPTQVAADDANSTLNTPDRVRIGSEVIESPGVLPPNKLGFPLLRPALLSSPSSILTGNHLQGSGRMQQSSGEAVDKNVIWASIVKLVDGYLLEQLKQKRDIDKSLEDSLYSSIRDLVKTILPAPRIDPTTSNFDEDAGEGSATGCARALPFVTRKPRDMFSFLMSEHRRHLSASQTNGSSEEMSFDQTQRRVSSFGGDMSTMGRFRQMSRRPLSNTVYVSRSDIHSRGLFGARDIEAGEALVEYTGQVIRAALTDKRERHYEGLGVGCYMFRLDKTRVVDATLTGSAARFINHSCEPNCYSRVIQSSTGVKHIVIFSLRDIKRGEELTYDYKFPIENIKIPCSCGSKKCRRYLN